MERANKVEQVGVLKDRFDRMTSAVFVDFSGMNVAEVSSLRARFKERGVEYKVCKNTLIRLAIGDQPYAETLGNTLRGMTGVAWSYEEPSAAARVVKEFRKENEKLVIKAGLLDGQVLDNKGVENQLATLPNKDEARAMLLAQLMAPAQTLVRLLAAPATNFVHLLNAKKAKSEG
ncbi:MAG: 50S ribosomal protein L10 [Polyangiaceae bacterium]|nr:50S ribosomal protein L10 [Polyangiaceae bacterium]MCW5792171.1 50S ribosomal protein L10 [Polyangiaceae bacterium]